MLKLEKVSFRYANYLQIFQNLSLDLKPGCIYGLLGVNGVGKSSLLYLMSGMLRPNSGVISLDGVAVTERRPATLADIFIVPEEFTFPAVSLKRWMMITSPFYPKFSLEKMREYIKIFGLQESLHLGRLSMGQKKKVMVAFALACNTSLLLMDEPTNGLDIPGKSDFRRAITSAINPERTIVISTHQVRDLEQVIQHVDILSPQGLLLDADLDYISRRYSFMFSPSPENGENVLFCAPTMGGFAIIRERQSDEPLTPVSLELLFECLYTYPQLASKFV